MTIQDIEEIFKTEFGAIANKFILIEENLSSLYCSKKAYIYHPGVYIFFLDGNVIKVGRHLVNSRKRALEHIKCNTKNECFEMKSLEENTSAKVLLLNLKDPSNYHWSASAEIFLEKKLNPVIKSKRQG
ncbi:hypothetical protein D9V96_019460 [Zobellia laminariae]|uniref:hypothetical protein n=1 Tax=Zobellia laminariae TaxID=248906 RepID=UPI0012D925DF|nr:hypothetical protein [Zobellia laminariae]